MKQHIIDTDELEKLPRYEQDKFLVRYEDVVKLIVNSPQVPDTVPRAEYNKLLGALKEAAEDIEDWGSYAPDFFQEKHNLAGDIAKYRAIIAEAEGKDR